MILNKHQIIVMLFILFSLKSIAQPDSKLRPMFQVHKGLNDTSRVNELLRSAFFDAENGLQAEEYLKQAYDMSNKLGYRRGVILGQYFEVYQLSRSGKYDEAILKCIQCINQMDSMDFTQHLNSFPLSDIRVLYNQVGKQEEKLAFYTQKAEYYKLHGPRENLAGCYHGIAGYYHHYGNHEKAIQYYMRAWEVCKTFDPAGCANEQQVIGAEYMEWGNLEKAEEYLKSALSDELRLNNGNNAFYCYHKLGDIYFKKQNFRQALANYLQGRLSCSDSRSKAIHQVSCASVYLMLNLNDSARLYLDSAEKIRQQEKLGIFYTNGKLELDYNFFKYYKAIGNTNRAIRCLEAAQKEAVLSKFLPLVLKYTYELHVCFLAKGDSLRSLRFLMQYQYLQDSLLRMNTRVGIANFESDKEALLKEKEIEHLEIQKAAQRTYYLIGISFLGIISIGAFSRFRYIRRTDKEKLTSKFRHELAEAEAKALRAQMNPHFIFNSLNSINCFIIDKDHTKASEYLIKFARLIRLILENSSYETIPLAKELESLELYIVLEGLRFENKFVCVYHIDKCIDKQAIMIPPMLLQPFVENAIWHGLMHKDTAGSISIIIKRTGPGLLKISILDDGVGREKAAEINSKSGTHKSFGIEVTTHRIEMMNKLNSTGAQMHIIDLKDEQGRASGTRVDLIIPV